MAAFEKAKVIDGFSSIQAVRRKKAGGEPDDPHPQDSSSEQAERQGDGGNQGDAALKKARIGHTALPPKYEILCYECGYAFTVTGRLHNVICPKCREQLEVGDYVIAEERVESIKTIGAVTVKAGGVLRGVSVIARDLILEGGIVEDTHVRACGCVRFGRDAFYKGASINTRDVLICAGAEVVFKKRLMCRRLDVKGDVKGRLTCEEAMTVHAGGVIRGEVVTEHLIVHDGGGLKARIRVGDRKAARSSGAGKAGATRTWELPPLASVARKRHAAKATQPELPVDVDPPPEKEECDSTSKENSDGQETRTG